MKTSGDFQPKKTVDVLPPVQGFAVLLRATALAVKNGSSQGLDREMRTNSCRESAKIGAKNQRSIQLDVFGS